MGCNWCSTSLSSRRSRPSRREKDIISTKVIVEATTDRITVRDTTIGKELQVQIDDLKNLLAAYRSGQIKERK